MKDLADRSEIEISHEGTDKMLPDVQTKPKQGSALKRLRAKFMNYEVNYYVDAERACTHFSLITDKDLEKLAEAATKRNTGVQNIGVAAGRLVGNTCP